MKIVDDIHSRVPVTLKTPLKGTIGDMTDENDVGKTRIESILARYAGRLPELNAWRGKLTFGDATSIPDDIIDAQDILLNARASFEALEDKPFASFDDALAALRDGTYEEKVAAHFTKPKEEPQEVPNEVQN